MTKKATTIEDQIAEILAPAIDPRAPYAKAMIAKIAELKVRKLQGALLQLLGQVQQGSYVHMITHSPSMVRAVSEAEEALGMEPGSSYCKTS